MRPDNHDPVLEFAIIESLLGESTQTGFPYSLQHWTLKSNDVRIQYYEWNTVRKWRIADPYWRTTQYTFANLLVIIKRPRWRKARGLPPIEDDHG